MAVPFTYYIDVTSSEGGTGEVPERALVTRIFTTNPKLPPKSFLQESNIEVIGDYFGTASEEYLRAAPYLPWISKQGTSPQLISFARWVEAASAPQAYGDPAATASLTALNAIVAGELEITIGAASAALTGVSFAADGSLAAVAATLQTALQAEAGFSTVTVVYNSTFDNFIITGGTTGTAAGAISFTNNVSNTIGLALGMLSANTVLAAGSDVETITQTLNNSTNASTNFATFLFLTGTNPLNIAQYEEAAQWNVGQNNAYGLLVPVSAANAATWSAALIGFAGTALTLTATATDYAEMLPGKVLAATNYDGPNASQNYMLQQDPSLTIIYA